MVGSNAYYDPNRQVQRITIPYFYLIETERPYADMYQRTYDITMGQGNLNRLDEALSQNRINIGLPLTEGTLLDVAPDMMGISNMPGSKVAIANGWQQQRFRWIMLVIEQIGEMELYNYVQGYTDYSDVSLQGSLDPRMHYYINSITTVKKSEDFARPGQFIYNLAATYNVITDFTGAVRFEETPFDTMGLVRPMDIFDSLAITASTPSDMYATDLSTIIKPGTVNTSKKANNNPIKHIVNTVNGAVSAKLATSMSYDPAAIFLEASNRVNEARISNNGFIKALFKVTGNPAIASFSADDLKTIYPAIKPTVFLGSTVTKDIGLDAGFNFTGAGSAEASEFSGVDVETTKALTAMHSINSILVESFVNCFAFSLKYMNGNFEIIPAGIPQFFLPGIPDDAQKLFVNTVLEKIKCTVIPMITHNGQLNVELHYVSDQLGETVIKISVNNRPYQIFRTATFADSLYVPVICDATHRSGVLDSYTSLVSQVYDRIGVM